MTGLLQLIRGAALAGFLAAMLLAAVLVVGLVGGASVLVFVVAAIGGLVVGLIPPGLPRKFELVGTILVGIIALIVGAMTGFGWLEICGVAGSILGVGVVLVQRRARPWAMTIHLRPWLVGVSGVAIAVLALVPLVVDGGTLGHDESAYALKARSWLEGTPDTGWSIHRGPALSAYGYLVIGAGGAESALRALGNLSVLALAVGTWALGNKIGGRWVGPLSAVAMVSGPAILRRGTEFLSDIPAAALLVFCMVIIWAEFHEREGPTYRLLWVLPLAWLAFYLRYQSALSLGLIGVTILVLWWDQIRLRPGPPILVVIVGLAGLIPHFLFSVSETGSLLGILRFTGQVAGRGFLGEGLVDYAGLLRWRLAGFVGVVVTIALIWWAAVSWNDRRSRIRSLFLIIPAVGQVIALGLISHGESRFVFFPLALTIVGGITGLFEMRSRWSEPVFAGVRLGQATLLIGSQALSIGATRRSVDNRILSNEPVELAANVVANLAAGEPCGVMTSYNPQITFYSSCFTDVFRPHLEASEAVARLEGDSQFMVLIEDGKRQPTGDALLGLVDLTTGAPVDVIGRRDSAQVFEFGS